jgi:DNA repair protein RecO (recombination protein O)
MHACLSCGVALDDPEHPERAWFRRGVSGLMCGDCRRVLAGRDAWELSLESRMIAGEMLRRPVGEVGPDWQRETASDLRRFLQQQIETHIERRLITVPVLEAA